MNRMERFRFTERARRALSLAQESAEILQHNSIRTEHLLLGLVREDGGIAGTVLRELGLTRQQVEALVRELSAASGGSAKTPELAPSVRKALEKAVEQARKMGHHYIGTEHLLLGLIEQKDSTAVTILARLGVSPQQIRQYTLSKLQESGSDRPSPTPMQPPFFDERRKVLQMIDDGRITALEGAELLKALQIVAVPFPLGMNAIHAFAAGSGIPMEQLQARAMRLIVRRGDQTEIEIRRPMQQVQGELFLFLQRFYSGQSGKILDVQADDKTIDVFIDEEAEGDEGTE